MKVLPPPYRTLKKLGTVCEEGVVLTMPEAPVKCWRHPTGARTGLVHSYW